MDRAHQIDLISGAGEDYQNGLMSLGDLIHVIVALLEVVEDEGLNDELWESRSTLEQIYAGVVTGYCDFEKDGKSDVEQAVADIISKTRAASAALRSIPPTS